MRSLGLHNRRALGIIVGKFSEHKTVTSVFLRGEILREIQSLLVMKLTRMEHHGVLCSTKLLKLF